METNCFYFFIMDGWKWTRRGEIARLCCCWLATSAFTPFFPFIKLLVFLVFDVFVENVRYDTKGNNTSILC
jgi:hypothetical protein